MGCDRTERDEVESGNLGKDKGKGILNDKCYSVSE